MDVVRSGARIGRREEAVAAAGGVVAPTWVTPPPPDCWIGVATTNEPVVQVLEGLLVQPSPFV